MFQDHPTATDMAIPRAVAGETWIADSIVAKVAATAAREVEGVVNLRGGGGVRRGWVRASERGGGGADVAVADGIATIAMKLVVRDDVAIPEVVAATRARVVNRVEFITGMTVARVNVGVVNVVSPAAAQEVEAPEPEEVGVDGPETPATLSPPRAPDTTEMPETPDADATPEAPTTPGAPTPPAAH